MRTAPAGLVPCCLAAALLAGACVGPGPRPRSAPGAFALPEHDPANRGTVQGPRLLTEAEQVVVRMGRDAEGKVVVLQVLSPVLTPEQQQEVMRAFKLGGWKRAAPAAEDAESWIETIVKNK